MNKEEIIIAMMKEVREDQRLIWDEMKQIRQDQSEIKQVNRENHLNWVEHKRNTEALEKIVDQQGIRIIKLEEPKQIEDAIAKKKEEELKKAELKNKKLLMIITTSTAIISLFAALAKALGWI